MSTPGFTAEAAMYSRAVLVHRHASDRNHAAAGTVTMAGYYYCGQCPLGKHECPNPDGFGCNVCAPRNVPCSTYAPPR
jgi:hypothetical protein